jgi:hypothetical protein
MENSSQETIANYASIALKAATTVLVVSVTVAGLSMYGKFNHSGPSCDKVSMSDWINGEKVKGVVLSAHESKLQTKEGSTNCFGVFKNQDGAYKNWTGRITNAGGEIIGWARLD